MYWCFCSPNVAGEAEPASCPTTLWLATKAVTAASSHLRPRGVCATKCSQTPLDKNTPKFPQTDQVRNPDVCPKPPLLPSSSAKQHRGFVPQRRLHALPQDGIWVKPGKSGHLVPSVISGLSCLCLPRRRWASRPPPSPGRPGPQACGGSQMAAEAPCSLSRPSKHRRRGRPPKGNGGEPTAAPPAPHLGPTPPWRPPAPPRRAEPRRHPPPQNVRHPPPRSPRGRAPRSPAGSGGARVVPGPLRPIGPGPARPRCPPRPRRCPPGRTAAERGRGRAGARK